MRTAGHPGAERRRCEKCGADVWQQLVGRRAALTAVVDATPLPYEEALRLAEPNRLVWCAVDLRGARVDLRWLHPRGAACRHAHVIDHQCPPGTPTTPKPEGAPR